MTQKASHLLAELRREGATTTAHLAQRAGKPRSWTHRVLTGKADPQVGTLDNVARSFDMELALVPIAHTISRISADHIERLEALRQDPKWAYYDARRGLLEAVANDLAAEHIDIDFRDVRRLLDATTIQGEPLDVWRATKIARSARDAVKGEPPQLLTYTGEGGRIQAPEDLPSPHRELDFLVRAIQVGADPTRTRHQVNAHLLQGGYPWLQINSPCISEHRRGLHLLLNLSEPSLYLETLIEGAEEHHVSN